LGLSNLTFELLLMFLTIAIAWRREGRAPERMLAWQPWPKNRSFLPYLGLTLVWQLIAVVVIEPHLPELASLESLPSSEPGLVLLLLNTAVFAPFAEELFFRGFLYSNVRAHVGFAPTIVLTTLMFCALQYPVSPTLAVLAMPSGLIAGLAREHFGS